MSASAVHAPGTSPDIAVSGITKRFDDALALDNASFEVADGESAVLIGPSASGKTVALKVIAGLKKK